MSKHNNYEKYTGDLASFPSNTGSDTLFVSGVTSQVENNLQEDLGIARLAARVFLSERQFRRIFNQTFGESPGRAVERIRIDVAQDLLTSKSMTIEQISVDTGFQSADAFRRAFYRRTGVNPTDYRLRFNCL